MSLNITKTGLFSDNYIIEPYMTLADGSYWQLMLYHYIKTGNTFNLFTASNNTYCNDFGLYSRLAWIDDFKYDNKYEFYVIQDGKLFRWTQTSKPTAGSINGMTTILGNPTNGLARAYPNYTYLGYNTWWGACGSTQSYSTGGASGIPGFGPHNAEGIAQYYLALYTRIENPKASIDTTSTFGNNFYEY